MRPLDAAARLKAALHEAQVRLDDDGRELHGDGADWREVWEAFCALAQEPAHEPFERHGLRLHVPEYSTDTDLLLHESGAGSTDPFVVYLSRQFTFEDEAGAYAGMNALTVDFVCDRGPEGRVPQAQRWGYAGRRQEDASDDSHPEMRNWAGWVESWKRAAEASNSFKVLDEIPPARWRIVQSDI